MVKLEPPEKFRHVSPHLLRDEGRIFEQESHHLLLFDLTTAALVVPEVHVG